MQAGDLHSSTGYASSETYRPLTRTFSILNTPRVPRYSNDKASSPSPRVARVARSSGDDFDLREEVMSCIAKSIGLLQPPLSGTDSVEESPALPPTISRGSSGMFESSFGSLSLLELGNDTSSMTGGSSSIFSGAEGGYMSGLDNEVEILFFAAGSTLAKAGDLNTGLFYVIEGFLDIFLPLDEAPKRSVPTSKADPVLSESEPWRTPGPPPFAKGDKAQQKLLFTVKPGGIAGYLGTSFHLTLADRCMMF